MKKGDLVRFKQPENHALFLCLGDRVRFVRDHPKLKAMVEVENTITTQWVRKDDIEIVEEKSVDELIREAERNKDHSPEDRAAWLRLRMGRGDLSEGQLEFMAHCGDAGASLAGFRRDPTEFMRFVGVAEYGPRAIMVAISALATAFSKAHQNLGALGEVGVRVAVALDEAPSDWPAHGDWPARKPGDALNKVQEFLPSRLGRSFLDIAPNLSDLLNNGELSDVARNFFDERVSEVFWGELRRWSEGGFGRYRPSGHTEDPPSLSPPTPEQLAPVPLMAEGTQQDDAIPEADVYEYDPDFIPVVPGSREFLQTQLEHHQRMTEALQKALQQPDVEAATADFEEFSGRPRLEEPYDTES